MRIPRKLKKRIIYSFGRGTYNAIINGYLTLTRCHHNRGTRTTYFGDAENIQTGWYHAEQYSPFLCFPKIIRK